MIAFPPSNILVGFDFTPRSLQAWRYAEALAKRVKAGLTAVYVSPWTTVPEDPLAPAIPPPLTEEQRADLRARMKRALGEAAAVSVLEGEPVSGILTTAKTIGADLIVMATAGRTGLSRAVMGSITEAVVRLSPIPVLSLTRKAVLPKSVLAPVSLQPYSIAGFHAAEAVAATMGAKLTLLHVKDDSTDDGALIRLALTADASRSLLRLDLDTKVVQGKPVAKILEEASEHDLVVLVAHRRGLFRDGLLGTTAEQVLRRCPVPVLAVPAQFPVAGNAGRAASGARRKRGRPLFLRGRRRSLR